MNRNQIYRKTIAYCMVWMMVLQLFTGWGVKEVSAEGGIPAIKININVNDAKIYSAEDCAQVDNVDAWAIPYEIEGLEEDNTVYLSVESTQTGGSPVTLVDKISLTGTDLTWGAGAGGSDQVAVKFAESDAAKGTVYLKKPDAEEEYKITITVKDALGTEIASKDVTVTYITAINAPTVTLTDLNSSLEASVVDGSVSGTWTKQDVTFNIKVQDAVVGLKSITYELDGVTQTEKSYSAGSYEKNEVTESFTVNTSASSATGHKLVVTAVNAREDKVTTFTRYILVDKDAPGIALTIKETGSAVEDNKVYGNPVTMAASVTEALSATGMVVTYKVKKDGGSVVPSTVTASPDGTYDKVFTEDGTYEVSVVAVDEAGNEKVATPVTFTVDGTKPVITQTSAQENGKYYNADQTFQYKVTDANLAGGQVSGKIERVLDGTTADTAIDKNCSDSEVQDSHTCDEEGAYQITVNARDAAGNRAAAAHEIGFVVDKTAPVLGILAKDTADQTIATGGKTKKNVKVTYQVTDRNHQFNEYVITVKRTDAAGSVSNDTQRVDSANWTLSSTDTSKQNNITANTTVEYSEEGSYEITFSGKDVAGNEGTQQTISFVIDKTEPVISGVSYTTNQVAITPKYGIIFGNQIIQVNFTVEDAFTGLKTDKPVLVTIGTAADRNGTTTSYPAQHVSGGSYYVQLPLESVTSFDNKITIWAYDQVENEQSFESERTIYNTNSSTITMTCTTGNEGVWTKDNVTYRTRVTDTLCGIRSITYNKIETVNGSQTTTQVHKVQFSGDTSSEMTTEYEYDFTAADTALTADGYKLQVKVVNNCGTTTTMEKTVYVDKVAPVVELSGVDNEGLYKTEKTICTTVTDVSYRNTSGDSGTTTHYYVTCKRGGQDVPVSWENFASTQYTDTAYKTLSEEGNYKVYAVTTDSAGNQSTSNTLQFAIDHTAPVIGDVTYTAGGELIGPKYGIYFNKQAIRVSFSVKDTIVGLKDSGAVLVTVGKRTDRNNGTTLYPATSLQGDTYCVTLPLEDVNYFDNTITIWAYDKLSNEGVLESVRTIFNTNASDISMECTTDNDGVWTNEDVTYHTVVTDTKCGISKITYTKIETVDGVEQREVVKEVDFEQQRQQGRLSEFVTEYAYDFTATETSQTVDGYVLRVDVINNCDVSTFMEKKVYIDKVAPEVTLSGTENGVHYNTDQTVHTVVKDLSYPDTKTQYYVACQYDGRSVDVTWDDFRSTDYTDETDKVVSAEGTYQIYAVTTDSAGNQTTSNTLRFIIDKEAPVIVEARVIKGIHETEQPVNGDGVYYVNGDGKLAVKVTDHFPSPDGHVYVEGKLKDTVIQQEEYVMDSSPFSFVTQTPYTEEGKYAVMVSGKDKANNTAVNVYRDIVVDKTSPQLTISGIGQGQMTREPVTLTYQSVDKNHDFEQYRVTVRRTTLDGVDETLVEQNATDWKQTGYDRDSQENYTITRTSVYKEEGSYEVTFEGTDKAGNIATVKTIAFSIDHTAPVISDISYSDPSGLLTPKYQIVFSNQVIQVKFHVEDRVVGIEDSLVYVTLGTARERLEGAPMYIANKSGDGYYYVNIPSDLAVKEYDGVLSIWANDRLKNESVAETVRMIQNEDKPAIMMDCDLDYTKWQSRNVTFHTKVSDPKSGLKEVTYTIDGKEVKKVTFTEFVKEYSYDLTATKTADKVTGYSMTIEVTNNNGTSSSAKRQVYIDKKAPSVKLSGINNGTHYNQNQKITTNVGDVSFKNTKTQYHVERTLDGKTYSEKISSFTLKKYEGKCIRTFHKEGRYKVYAVTTDSAGNRTKSNTLHFVVDKTAPKLAISGVQEGSMNGTDVEIQFRLTDSFYSTTDSLIRIEKTIDGTTTSEEKKDFPKTGKHSTWNRTFSEDGTYQITFTAKDKAGNVAKTQTISFSVDKTQPVIEITGTSNYQQWDKPVTVRFSVEESYYTGDQITIQGTRQDINGKKEELEFTTFANIAKVSSMTQLFEKDGIYDLVLKAKDEAGNEDQKEIHFVLDQTRPEVHKVGNYNGGYYQEFSIADTLEEVFKDLTVVSYRILLNGIEYDGTTPITEEGKYNLSVDVEDELGHKTSETAEFFIDHTAPKVIFTGVKDGQSVTESGVITLSLTNPEDEITGVSMNGTSYGADVRQLEYAEYGRYHIAVDCVDKAGNKVTRTIQFTYHNPLTTTILFAIMGGLIVITCIWLWMRTMKKEKEEKRI